MIRDVSDVTHRKRGLRFEKSQHRKIVSLSLCRKTFKLKGNKKFCTWTKNSCFFLFQDSYVIYMCLMDIINVLRTGMNLSISRIHILAVSWTWRVMLHFSEYSLLPNFAFLLSIPLFRYSWVSRKSLWLCLISCTFYDCVLSSLGEHIISLFLIKPRHSQIFPSYFTLVLLCILCSILSVPHRNVRSLLSPLWFVPLLFSISSVGTLWVYNCLGRFANNNNNNTLLLSLLLLLLLFESLSNQQVFNFLSVV